MSKKRKFHEPAKVELIEDQTMDTLGELRVVELGAMSAILKIGLSRNKGMIIICSGVCGTGKTTSVERIVKEITAKDFQTRFISERVTLKTEWAELYTRISGDFVPTKSSVGKKLAVYMENRLAKGKM